MDRSGFLPEPGALEALLAAAGLATGAELRPPPARVEPAELLRFPRAPTPAATETFPAVAPLDDDTVAWEPLEEVEETEPRTRGRITLPPIEHAGGERPESLAELASIEERLEVLVGWLMGSTAAYSAFVADADGLALANRNAPDNYVAATAMIGRAQRMLDAYVPAPADGSTSMELEDGNTLHVVWATTDDGVIAAGMVLAEPLPRPFCATVREMVRAAVTKKETR